jgi:hypothetical protein
VVAVDGVFQRAPIHYTASNNTITFSSAPPSSSNVHVRHLGFRTTQTITALPANTTISQPVLQSPSYTGTLTGGTGEINIGSGQLYKGTNGRVGIGTTSPNAPLDIVADSSAHNLYLRMRSNNDFSFLRFRSLDGSEAIADIGVERTGTNVGNLRFYTNNGATITEHMRIRADGSRWTNANQRPAFECRAWVNFNGQTSPGTIRGSGNVSSVTRNSTGDYTVNFATAMPDTIYSALCTCGQVDGGTGNRVNVGAVSEPLTTSVRVLSSLGSNTNPDNPPYYGVSIFR